MDEIRVTPMSQCLEKKLKIMGFEIPDVLAVFIVMSLLNFIFGPIGWKVFTVWLPTLALAGFLKFVKRGKPEKHLIHLSRYRLSPKTLSAFSIDEKFKTPPTLFYEKLVKPTKGGL